MCAACYQRAWRGSPAVGGQCAVCGLDDVRLLRAVQLGDAKITACHNHGWLVERARPRPTTLAEALEVCSVPGDRRRPNGDRRRGPRRTAYRPPAIAQDASNA